MCAGLTSCDGNRKIGTIINHKLTHEMELNNVLTRCYVPCRNEEKSRQVLVQHRIDLHIYSLNRTHPLRWEEGKRKC